ncbi:TetR/AcrR family transcriptional regulator [Occultella glacieicola]|uniref:TetR/AcrR family transcriptional regulator n=1 Tax=Occultella glacieicola TaxID=2518684 RepID=A0ABY2E709_9MICO|nr:TetR/AcrR family transcriptional regulator [Occultella glacieicola]TDE97342.1 TetR/AcrR family transcriptional regulator [Occultella glacieicola]
MRAENRTIGQSASFIEAARRAQIMTAAIETVNEVGYHRASLAQIASRAGIAKSIISYHFASKENLLLFVVNDVFARMDAATGAAARTGADPAARLAAYLRAYLAFVRDHREETIAAVEIAISHRDADGTPLYLAESEPETALLEGIISDGIASGQFCDVDLTVARTTLIHALDGGLTRSQMDARTDLDTYGDHLVPMLLAGLGYRPDG